MRKLLTTENVLVLSNISFYQTPTGSVDMDKVHYCERFLELLVDLEVFF